MQRNVILCGDVREQLRTLPEESVHMVVTSPPYWSLRDYKVDGTIWGGDEACEHSWTGTPAREAFAGQRRWQHGEPSGQGHAVLRSEEADTWGTVEQGAFCAFCGAWRGAFGLEPTPDLYVEHMTDIFREIRRVLRKDGTCWLNLGDSYSASRSGPVGVSGLQGEHRHSQTESRSAKETAGRPNSRWSFEPWGLKPKDLVGIPWRVAFALQADGWWLRSDTIWSKPNPMPESVGDRPTRAHEYLFLLAKSQRYYYDADAIRERYSPATVLHVSQATFDSQTAGFNDRWDAAEDAQDISPSGRNKRSVWEVDEDEYAQFMQWKALMSGDRRDVWSIATRPFAEAHFATYAPDLIKPCILAGTSEYGVCAECGAPWERVTEKPEAPHDGATASLYEAGSAGNRISLYRQAMRERGNEPEPQPVRTLGWRATCKHHQPAAGFERSIVLDPFMGSGTTAFVALRAGRDYIGIDLNAEYIEMAERRLASYKNQRAFFFS